MDIRSVFLSGSGPILQGVKSSFEERLCRIFGRI